MFESINNSKPLLRGYLHQEAFFITLGACAILVSQSEDLKKLIVSLVYSFGLLFLFGFSAVYHRPHWQAKSRSILKRIDHSAIFILIAATFTPICVFSLPQNQGYKLLIIIWFFAIVGILQSIFWIKAPKGISALFYIAMGWIALPYIYELKLSLGLGSLLLIIGGGVFYTVGALFYAFKKPNLFPHIFGYHELFHACTVIAAFLHFIVIFKILSFQ